MTQELIELTTDANLAPITPNETIADMILEAVVCYAQIEGVVPVIGFDMNAGTGGTVSIPIIAARNMQGPFTTGCQCLSLVSSTFSTVTVTVSQYGDADRLCSFSFWKAKQQAKDKILTEMAKGIAHGLDALLWALLITGTQHAHTTVACNSTSVVTTGGCCVYAYDLFDQIVNMTATMQAACYNPDYIIMNPTVSAKLKMCKSCINDGLVTIDAGTGKISRINGLQVIESGTAAACSGTTNTTMAVIVDSSRALAEAWGMRPLYEETRVPLCNYYQETVWIYWGAGIVDNLAIGQIRNPA